MILQSDADTCNILTFHKRSITSTNCCRALLRALLLPLFVSLSKIMITSGTFASTHRGSPHLSRHLRLCSNRVLLSVQASSSFTFRSFSSASGEENAVDENIQVVKSKHNDTLQQQPIGTIDLIDPMKLVNFTIPFPKSLSPTSAKEFLVCPQSYFFQYILGIKQPPNEALVKGTMCHAALQKIFDVPPPERTVDALKNLLRSCWKEKRNEPYYQELFVTFDNNEARKKPIMILPNEHQGASVPATATSTDLVNGGTIERVRDLEAERKWGTEALELLENYYEMEDPRNILYPNPYRREMWITANLSVDHSQGVTFRGNVDNNTSSNIVVDNNTNSTITPEGIETGDNNVTTIGQGHSFLVRGIIDRLDCVRLKDGQTVLRLIDYKTGKSPNFKYSKAMNVKIAEENFWQLKVYALLLRETMDVTNSGVRFLRLMFLTSENGKAQYIDMDLGRTPEQRDEVLATIHSDLSSVWTQICKLVQLQDAKAFTHCNRPYCFCHQVRPYLKPETVWDAEKP